MALFSALYSALSAGLAVYYLTTGRLGLGSLQVGVAVFLAFSFLHFERKNA